MVAGNFLGGGNLYDDDGALVTGLPFQFKNGLFSQSVETGTASGSISTVYDGSISTGYNIVENAGATLNYQLKWDFRRKIPFKNIYVYLTFNTYSAGTQYVYLEGSNDDSTWTTIDTVSTASTAAVYKNLLATDVDYRYIRIRAYNASNNQKVGILKVEGST